ncbi:translin-associated protein X-like [Asterias rubens]|uniref:translin-associated protein X-like n=1 Tax=Asterias rubens TaxID=7604 RepID=UPI001454EE32|nr:translin-associated protein X-like [Asterias rubens]
MGRDYRQKDDGYKSKGPSKRAQHGDSWSANRKVQKGVKLIAEENSEVVQAFRVFQNELDTKHDKHERLVKLSRDVTIESKRTIFLLHRITGDEDRETVIKEAEDKIKLIQSTHILQIAKELQGQDPFLFQRAISPGFQEYVEAVLFLCYIKEKKLMTLEEVRGQLVFQVPAGEDSLAKEDSRKSDVVSDATPDGEVHDPDSPMRALSVSVSPMDYVLGIADFTGELMRMCINSIGNGDTETPFVLVTFMQQLYDCFQLLGNTPGREYTRKMSVMRQSLAKVENACYMLRVRGSEFPKHMLLDAISALPGGSTDTMDLDT